MTLRAFLTLLTFGLCLVTCNDEKSCEEWYKEVVKDCCNGQSSCSLENKMDFMNMCGGIDEKCGSGLECSGQPGASSCAVKCGCG